MKASKRAYILAGIFAATGCAICAALYLRFNIPAYTPPIMINFSSQTRTHCIGRFLVDLPAELGNPIVYPAIFYFGSGADFKQVELKMPVRKQIDQRTFDEMVAARTDELVRGRNDYMETSMLIAEKSSSTPNGRATILRRLEAEVGWVGSLISELHTLVNGKYVILLAESFPPPNNGAHPDNSQYKQIDASAAEQRLILFAQNLRGMENREDIKAGFCLNDIIVDQAKIGYDDEKATFGFNYSDSSQPKLSIDMNGKFGNDEETLFDRSRRLMASTLIFEDEVLIRKLRKSTMTIAGIHFQQWAHETYTKTSGVTRYTYMAENIHRPDQAESFIHPSISITLVSGDENGKFSSPYSLSQLETAWDQWLATLRLTSVNKHKQAD